MSERESNYEIFKRDALNRFLTYDQEQLIRRLHLKENATYIYINFLDREYRISRQVPMMEYRTIKSEVEVHSEDNAPDTADVTGITTAADDSWREADTNSVLTICDLLCHTEKPLVLSGDWRTLEGLNRVKAGTKQTTLGDGFYAKYEKFFDANIEQFDAACRKMGGVRMGKGDVAYRIPIYESIGLYISFYASDDEFPAKVTFFLDRDICEFMFYESLWYMIHLVLDILMGYMEGDQ